MKEKCEEITHKKVVVTGASGGIGYATCARFLIGGNEVIGIDVNPNPKRRVLQSMGNYSHIICDIAVDDVLPEIPDVSILVNNAGTQVDGRCIDVNLRGLIRCTEEYALSDKQERIESVVNLASVSAHNGAEFPEYVASKGGVLAYTKWCAKELAKKGATCNSISFGGVKTGLNDPIYDEPYWTEIMGMTPLKKWASTWEAAGWIYFMSVVNRSCTGQDIIVDNGEMLNHRFVWPDVE